LRVREPERPGRAIVSCRRVGDHRRTLPADAPRMARGREAGRLRAQGHGDAPVPGCGVPVPKRVDAAGVGSVREGNISPDAEPGERTCIRVRARWWARPTVSFRAPRPTPCGQG